MLGSKRWLPAVLVLSILPAQAEAAKRAQPKLTKVAASLPAPQLLDVTVRLKAPKRSVRATRVKIMLSADRRLDRKDVLFGEVRTKRIKRRKAAAVRLRSALPAGLSGKRYVLACLTSRRCAATAKPLVLTTPPTDTFVPPFTGDPAPQPEPAAPTPSPAPGGPPPPPPPPPAMPDLPADIVSAVTRLEDAGSLAGEIEAARSLLAAAGIGDATDLASRAAAQEDIPSGIALTDQQLLQAARDGNQRRTQWRTTLADLADQLAGAGMPFTANRPDGSISSPSSALRDFLADAARIALENPADPDGHPVLLLAELARRQAVPIDITVPDYDPSDLRLGHLDILLLTAQITRLAPVVRGDQAPPQPRNGSRASTPCTDVQKELEKGLVFGGDAFGYLWGKTVGTPLKAMAQRLAQNMGGDAELAGEGFDRFMTALNVVAKLQMLTMLYSHTQTKVVPEVELMDKPDPGTGKVIIRYDVVAGVDDAEWDAYKTTLTEDPIFQAMKDCASVAGLPVPTSVADIGGAASSWRVSFRITEGLGFHGLAATQTYLNPGQLEKQMLPRDDHSARQDFLVEVQEADDPLAGGGVVLEEPLTVEASVETDPPPKVGMLISAIESAEDPLGIAGPIADLAAGLFQNLKTIKGTGTTMIRFAEPGAWYGRLQQTVRHQLGYGGETTTENGGYKTVQTLQRNEVTRKRTTVHVGSPIDDAANNRMAVSGGVVETLDVSFLEQEHRYIPPFGDWCTHEIDREAFRSHEARTGGGSIDRSTPFTGPDGTLLSAATSAIAPGNESYSYHRQRESVGGEEGCVHSTPEPESDTTDEAGSAIIGASVASPVAGYVSPEGDRRYRDTTEVQEVVQHGTEMTGGVRTTRTALDLTRR